MTWTRIADDFNDRPELDDLTLEARMLYVEGLVHCNRHLTDGVIKRVALTRFSRLEDAGTAAKELVDAGIWSATAVGWTVEGFTDPDNPDRQRSRETVEQERERSRVRFEAYQERGRLHGLGDHSLCTNNCPAKRNPVSNGNAVGNAVSNAVSNGAIIPSIPVLSRKGDRTGTTGAEERAPAYGARAPRREGPVAVAYLIADELLCEDHPGEKANSCRGCAADRKAGDR